MLYNKQSLNLSGLPWQAFFLVSMSVGQVNFGCSCLGLIRLREFICRLGWIYSKYSTVEQIVIQSMLFLFAMAGTQESKPEYTAVFKVFLMSHLLLFHWQRQVTWPSSTVADKESNRQGGKTYSVYIKARYA